MRRRLFIAIGVVVVALASAGSVAFATHHRSVASTSRSIPAGAQAAVRLLVSARGRQALTPELNAFLPKGRLFAAGTTFTARPGSWHQAGAYANVSGVLRGPGTSPAEAEIGLVQMRGHWLVTFEAYQ